MNKKILLETSFLFFLFFLTVQNSYSQYFEWAHSAGGTSDEGEGDITVDLNGNTFVTGSYYNTLNIDGMTLPNAGVSDVFVAKYDKAGNLLWAKKAGGSGGDYSVGIGTDKLGNCYVLGNIYVSGYFGATYFSGAGFSILFLAKYDTDGNLVWVQKADGANSNVNPKDLAVDENGNCYLTGSYGFSAGGKPANFGATVLTSTDDVDMFVAKYDSDGSAVWAKSAGGLSEETGRGIAIDSSGNCIVTGAFQKDITLESTTLTSYTSSYTDILIAKYDNLGNLIWATKCGGNYQDAAFGVTTDKFDNIYTTGYYETSATIGTTNLSAVATYEIFIAQFDAQGTNKWAKSAGSNQSDIGFDIKLDKKGFLYTIGNMCSYGTAAATPSASFGSITVNQNGGGDIYVAKLDTLGNFIWAQNMGGADLDRGKGIAVDLDGYIHVHGYYQYYFVSGNTYFKSVGVGDLMWASMNPYKYIRLSNQVKGSIFSDVNSNCIKDSEDKSLSGYFIKALPGPYYTITDVNGNYTLKLDSGTYTVSQIIPERKFQLVTQVCPASPSTYTVNVNGYYKTVTGYNFGNQVVDCSNLTVDVAASRKRRCAKNITTISYGNDGTLDAINAEIRVVFPKYIIPVSSTIPWTSKQDSLVIFNIASIPAGSSGKIDITDSVACVADISGLTQCIQASISPKSTCETDNPSWDKSSIVVSGKCENGYAVFTITNNGSNMAGTSELRVYFNNVLGYQNTFQLAANESVIVRVPGNGKTIRLEADQRPLHPGKSKPRATIEGCGTTNALADRDFVMQVPQDDADDDVEITCVLIVNSFDPNDKQVEPTGLTANHYTSNTDELEYMIRFQNTGTASALKVVVKDTINDFLDIRKLKLGPTSHNCSIELIGGNKPVLIWTFDNINLPDSTTDLKGSNGFVKYSIGQTDNNPEGTLINNTAYIFFDYNEPVITNQTQNLISDLSYEDFSQGLDVTIESVTGLKTASSQLRINAFPNPFTNTILFQFENSNSAQQEEYTLTIYDLTGKLIKSQPLSFGSSASTEFNAADLKDGLYQFRITSPNSAGYVGKIVKGKSGN